MQWGAQETFLRGLAAETGTRPKALASRPEPDESLRFMWNAFWELTGDRHYGALGFPGAIPFASIDRYAARYGLDDRDEFARFHHLIRRMDSAFIAHVTQKSGDGN